MDQKPTPAEARDEFLDARALETRVSEDGAARGPPNLYDLLTEGNPARCAPEPDWRVWFPWWGHSQPNCDA